MEDIAGGTFGRKAPVGGTLHPAQPDPAGPTTETNLLQDLVDVISHVSHLSFHLPAQRREVRLFTLLA
jgi:hypothetical protein